MTENRRRNWAERFGMHLAALAAVTTVTVQWGVVTTKLDGLERRLDEMIFETRTLRQAYQDMEHRLATLEGQYAVKEQNHGS